MKRVMVKYRVKADRADENAGYVARVFEQLHAERPEGVRYASFRLHDGVSFVHLVQVDAAPGHDPLRALPAFNEFLAGLHDRCDEQPVTTHLDVVGSYGVFGDVEAAVGAD